ncbi:uncharacterized protein LOC113295781 [Papaver somniferum]|uniref:uncharacterized protein LOC113295781 n=1 Tax=Papaver somniferum TaxID=3469 RepID=UPI000E6FEEEC|nr:uncharacterized protein LOC113295781 [Papaver somniferum]
MTHPEGASSDVIENPNIPPLNPEGERVGIVTDPITQIRKPGATREEEMHKELEDHIRREQELRKLMKTANAAKSAKETTENAEEKDEEPIAMTQEAMARYLEMNYRVVKQENYNFMASPYSSEITEYQYLEDYTSPKLKVYNGQGNAREHLSRFLSSMNDRATDGKLCLREFPKSLTDTTFSWYDNLRSESISSWITMSTLFLRKFYSAKRKVTTIDLSKRNQRASEEIGKYIVRFRLLTLDCQEDVKEEDLVEICVRRMTPSFKKSLVNFRFPTFV